MTLLQGNIQGCEAVLEEIHISFLLFWDQPHSGCIQVGGCHLYCAGLPVKRVTPQVKDALELMSIRLVHCQRVF